MSKFSHDVSAGSFLTLSFTLTKNHASGFSLDLLIVVQVKSQRFDWFIFILSTVIAIFRKYCTIRDHVRAITGIIDECEERTRR